MKQRIKQLLLIVCCLFSVTTYAASVSVSKEDALTIAQQQFAGQDVDYFLLQDNSTSTWTIFVDAEPMKGWEHDCYIVYIPKSTTGDLSNTPVRKIERKTPPSGEFVPLSTKNRYGSNAYARPSVNKINLTNEASEAALHTYAIILSGGVNKIYNYERYWNDCSFIYQTLVNKYGVPKDNIYPLMSDGNDPSPDMRCTMGGFASQPLDLDFDGLAEIELAATKANVQSAIETVNSKLQKNDQLFIFVIDHGGTSNGKSYICLWNNEQLYDYELAAMLNQASAKYANINVVLGQCFSGGFNDDLKKVGCVVASASTGDESSWSCGDIPYDEFVYQWTCAVNGANHKKVAVYADSDYNGRVTMEEAFAFAKSHDRADENPQYVSTPSSVGEDLSFNHLAPSLDLFIKDNPEDTGKEPNTTTSEFWKSPSIWVRNADDGGVDHQNPEYSSDHQMAYVYVKVDNRGKEPFNGEGKWVHVYWAQASTGLTTKAWKGREVYENRYPTGGHLEACPIEPIEPGKSGVVKIRWALPQLLTNYPEGNFHFCLTAKIMDTPYDDGYVDGNIYFDMRGKNDHAQKNVTIIRRQDVMKKGYNVYVRNISSTAQAYSLELIPQTEADTSLFSTAKVEMSMSPKIFAAWERGGFDCEEIELPSVNSNSDMAHTVKFVSTSSKLKNISLNANEFDIVNLKFDFNKYSVHSHTYTFDLVQKDIDGNIIGGETFIVESPALSQSPVEILTTPIDGGKYELNIIDNDFSSFMWRDASGIIGTNNSVVVTPRLNKNIYNVRCITEDGEIAVDEVELEVMNGIESISLSQSCNLEIKLYEPSPNNAAIRILSLNDSALSLIQSINEGENSISIDISTIPAGIYLITYEIESEQIDWKKIVKE